MKNYQLNNYFKSIDIKTVNPAHYSHTTNLMIDRGLIVGNKVQLFDTNQECEVF